MDWLSNHRLSNRDAVEKLKDLYVELLLCTVENASEDLGTRRNEELQDCVASPKRSLLRRSLSRSRRSSGDDALNSTSKSLRDTAFRLMSATTALDKDNGDNGGAVAVRDSATVSALSKARSVESKVVYLVRTIGEVVADGDHQSGTSIRSDAVFEYFCEKNMLSLLVDIAKAKPSYLRLDSNRIKLHEVAFSPRVKAQLLQTISILISNSQDAPSLYYLLSNNHVNELIMGMLPLRQWTNQALEEMLPLYVELLRGVGVQLAASPSLISFLTRNDESRSHTFPLFFAAIEVVTSSYANSDSFIHDKCLKLLVSLMQIPDPSIRYLISASTAEHQKLSLHICQRLLDRYRRLSMLTTGPVVDPIRSNAIAGQLVTLQNEIESLNDVLWCGVKSLNVRTCECLLQKLVSLLLCDLFSAQQRHLLAVGSTDTDVIPEREAIAQVAVLFLAQLFLRLEYPPFTRMLAVALLHPLSSTIWSKPLSKEESSIDSYILTQSLNRIVVQASTDTSEQAADEDIVPNPFRKELLSCISGYSGEWRFIPVAILLESVLSSEALDLETLVSLNVVPSFSGMAHYPESPFEEALATFLASREVKMSAVSVSAMERAGSLAVALIPHLANSMTNGGKEAALLTEFIHYSPLIESLRESRSRFCAAALQFKETSGVSQLFVDLIELAIKSRYLRLGESHSRPGTIDYGCPLETFSCSQQTRNADILVRKFRNVGSNDVEDARFTIRMAIHFRALCLAVDRMIEDCSAATPESGASFALDEIDRADDLLLIIGDLTEKPMVSTDLDLRGRMAFRFFPATRDSDHQKRQAGLESTPRRLPEEIGSRSKTQLVLVLESTDIFIVKHINRSDVNRGTIICSVSLRSVIACASDSEWLHVAVRNVEDVGTIIKNGNMALHFDSAGTCLIVRQYLERSRNILRSDLGEKIQELFSHDDETNDKSNQTSESETTDATATRISDTTNNVGGDDNEDRRTARGAANTVTV